MWKTECSIFFKFFETLEDGPLYDIIYILYQSHWHNQYTTGGDEFPIMRNYLALMIKPDRFHDNIKSDILTKAIETKLSYLYAWCENEDGNMIISDQLLSLDSARKYCEGSDF